MGNEVVWKFSSRVATITFNHNMPEGADILRIGRQGDQACMWVQCDPDKPREIRSFQTVGTGYKEITEDMRYVGTYEDGAYVWHVYEDLEKYRNRYQLGKEVIK